MVSGVGMDGGFRFQRSGVSTASGLKSTKSDRELKFHTSAAAGLKKASLIEKRNF
jgi:hypothetical protein